MNKKTRNKNIRFDLKKQTELRVTSKKALQKQECGFRCMQPFLRSHMLFSLPTFDNSIIW
jgi:hypothetical protein